MLEAEEKAKQDGRIGSETVLVDISSQCGTMNIGIERMEVGYMISFKALDSFRPAQLDKYFL